MRRKVEMADLILDEKLIDNFRDQINKHHRFKELCQNIDGKNKLNAIYSAMDWLTVAVDGTKSLNIKTSGFGADHQNTLNLMQYVVIVDLIFESIRQIYRVFDAFKVKYPYDKTSHIFNQAQLGDDDYFKHLRAIFGIHPVNLKSINGVEESNKRYFASWVAYGLPGLPDEADFSVQLYGNSIDSDEATTVGISLLKIDKYVRERYLLLEELIEIPKKITEELSLKYKGVEIELSSDRISNIKTLIIENRKRFGSFQGYGYLLHYMLDMFSVDFEGRIGSFDKSLIIAYLAELEKKLQVIKTNLETMEYGKVKIGIRARGYEFEKIFDYFLTREHPIGEEYFVGLAVYSDLPKEMIKTRDFSLYRLVYDAFLFSKMEGKEYLVYKELLNDNNPYEEIGVLGFTGYSL